MILTYLNNVENWYNIDELCCLETVKETKSSEQEETAGEEKEKYSSEEKSEG